MTQCHSSLGQQRPSLDGYTQ